MYRPVNAVKLWELKNPYCYKWINIEDGIIRIISKNKILPGEVLLWKRRKYSLLIIKLRVKYSLADNIYVVESLGFSYDN